MNLSTKSGATVSRGRVFSTASLLIAALAAFPCSGPAFGQAAYFSVTGDFNTVGGELDLGFGLDRSVASGETLGFATYASSGGTNEAGDTIADGPGDSVLQLFNASNSLIAGDDDQAPGNRDALLTFAAGDTPLPSPMTAQSYRLNLSDFNDDTDPFAVDLVGPADAFTLQSITPAGSGGATISSLKFGTQGAGSDTASYATLGGLNIDGPLVIGQTGNASFLQIAGTTTVDGPTTINSGDALTVLSGGTFNANDDVALQGGVINLIGNSSLNLAAGKRLTASGDALLLVGGACSIDRGTTFEFFTGADLSLPNALDIGSGSDGTLTVGGTGSNVLASTSSSTEMNWGFFGATAVVTVRDNANLPLGGNAKLNLGTSITSSTTGTLHVESGGTFNANAIDLSTAVGGSGTINVTGAGVFTTGTGATTINNTGTLHVNTAGLFHARGDFNITQEGSLGRLLGFGNRGEIRIDGEATLDGVLEVNTVNGYTPTIGETLEILQADGGVTGTFASFSFPSQPDGFEYNILTTPHPSCSRSSPTPSSSATTAATAS